MQNTPPPLYLVSACLVGLCTRYDGKIKPNATCLEILRYATWIPVCPEQLGGLPTPREAADIIGGSGEDVLAGRARVITKSGLDVSESFIKGASQVLSVACSQPVDSVILKANSPSCGCNGVTASLLRQHGFRLREF
ncbi:MAG: DUF523 domain-containing protein [Desulfocapsaceae bacterium]|nr:DUF523 domain-containing protein [Desulfocapsaceae bacterium]